MKYSDLGHAFTRNMKISKSYNMGCPPVRGDKLSLSRFKVPVHPGLMIRDEP